jgi:hypothetical protein
LLINGKLYGIPSAACYRRLFYDGATTMVDKSMIDKMEYGGSISENAQLMTIF